MLKMSSWDDWLFFHTDELAMHHRTLSKSEIVQRSTQGCYADAWERILVEDPLELDRVKNVSFTGTKVILWHLERSRTTQKPDYLQFQPQLEDSIFFITFSKPQRTPVLLL